MNTHKTFRPGCPAAMLAKSAVCVALVAGIAWIGVASLGNGSATDPSVDAAATATGITIRGDNAAAHRREVFEARRARFESRAGTQVADGHLEYPAP